MDFKSLFGRMKQTKQTSSSNPEKLASGLDENIKHIKNLLGSPSDLVTRTFDIYHSSVKCGVVYFSGLTNSELLHKDVIKPVQNAGEKKGFPEEAMAVYDVLKKDVIAAGNIKTGQTMDDVMDALLSGTTVFFVDGVDQALLIEMKKWEMRSVEEPVSETVIRGPRDGFVETLQTNLATLRRYIRDPNLRFDSYQVGRRSKKDLVVAYVAGVIHPDILKEVKRRLEAIDMDDAPESGFIEQWIEESFLSPFPQFINTERPDTASAAMLQGKVVILLDGSPFVLIAPSTLGNAMQSPEDYYERWTIGSLVRGLRYMAGFIAVFLPGLYIALSEYHQGLLPTKLAMSIAATREGVPFPAFVEALLMVTTMELLREAGARLPQTIGQTIGIVGGLVIGDAAVQAGIVSPIMVIVVALNAIASFAIPTYSLSITFRILAYFMMFAAGVFGLYGIILGYIMINIHIVNLKSIGVPYSSPFAPAFLKDFNDLVFRTPVPLLDRRPVYLQPQDDQSADKGGKQS
ncbi:Spore germination protein KA [Lentibacillus sp. JNUCC-1]|nr:Spore germination protein KA [Lentibacillus sp. JNUCC-1]